MSFGSVGPDNRTEAERVKQWLGQIEEEGRRERARRELAPVYARQHFHVEALEREEEVQEDGYRITRGGAVLALAVFWTGDQANAARQRIVAGGMIACVRQCFGQECGPKEEDDDGDLQRV